MDTGSSTISDPSDRDRPGQYLIGQDGSLDNSPFPTGVSLVNVVEELQGLYQGFRLESQIWARDGYRRCPYRALILFGLSPRTKDWLLVDICGRFFRHFPTLESFLAAEPSQAPVFQGLVRAGQVPFVRSAAEVIGTNLNNVPQDLTTLMKIRGVGEKVAECVVGYGWGREALPVDANVSRVVSRLSGLPGANRVFPASEMRERLKEGFNLHRPRLNTRRIAMIDLHELLRLHGQVVCTSVPKCQQCPLSGCRSRRDQYVKSSRPAVNPGAWDEWRELLLEPTCGNIRGNQAERGNLGGYCESGCI